jgi:cyclophilin family peptidyl-prolyl cis-trans isomerase
MTAVMRRSAVLDHFLAVLHELEGRYSWETTLLAHPVCADIDALRLGVAMWRRSADPHLPCALAAAEHPRDLPRLLHATFPEDATARIVRALEVTWPAVSRALSRYEDGRDQAENAVARALADGSAVANLCAALGTAGSPADISVYLVPFAPHPPGGGLIGEGPKVTGLYVDCRRFREAAVVDTVLALAGWIAMLGPQGDAHLSVEVARRLPGRAPYQRRLRVLLTKLILEVTAGFLARRHFPGHRSCAEVLGTSLRFPRLFAPVDRHWKAYLEGWLTRTQALDAVAAELSARSPRWFVDHVDPSSVAADFYLLELMASQGSAEAQRLFGAWLPTLASDLAVHLDAVIGNELGHYERVPEEVFGKELTPFLASISHGDSRVAWPRTRAALGHAEALRLAECAFAGPGAEYGGEAWQPVAAMNRRYVLRELPDRVFVDQCFTLEHNNGSLFDKYFDTEAMRSLLDAQALGDTDALGRRASAEVRDLWEAWDGDAGTGLRRVRAQPGAGDVPVRRIPRMGYAPPGSVGCGSREDPGCDVPGRHVGAADDVRVRRYQAKRPSPPMPRLDSAAEVVLQTERGDIGVTLWPQRKPYTVDNFLRLARGTIPWRHPVTGEMRMEPYYDGTLFHRRVPGFLLQGGDPSGTGSGGPGYRIVDEFGPDDDFTSPFVMGMANVGRDSAGGQFFITVAPAPHLAGRFAAFGKVVGASAQDCALAVAGSAEPVRLLAVSVTAG